MGRALVVEIAAVAFEAAAVVVSDAESPFVVVVVVDAVQPDLLTGQL